MKILQNPVSLGMAAAVLLLFPGPAGRSLAAGDAASVPLVRQYEQALEVDPGNLALRRSRGVALLLGGRPAEAAAELRSAYPAFSDSIGMNYYLGVALSRTGDADSAQLYLQQSEALGALRHSGVYPLPSAYYNVGLIYLEDGRTREALRIFRKVLVLDPDRVDIHRLLGEIYARNDRDGKAIESFSSYLEHCPDDAEVRDYLFAIYFNSALKEREEGRLDAARTAFAKALEISPESPVASYYLGLIAYQQKEWQEAVRRLADPYGDYPEDLRGAARPLLFNSALVLQQGGHPQQAFAAAASLLRRHPKDTRILYLAGSIHLALENFTEALRCYEQLLELEPEHRGARLDLADARDGAVDELIGKGQKFFRRGEYPAAAGFFRRALAIAPTDPTARAYNDEIKPELEKSFRGYLAAAESALAQGCVQEAITAAMKALELRPESEEAGALREKARAAARPEIERRLQGARQALENGELAPAEGGFAAVLDLDPENSEARRGLDAARDARSEKASSLAEAGKAFLDEGRLDEARDAFNSSLTLQADHPGALEGRHRIEALVSSMFAEELKWARRAASKGRLEAAEGHYRTALELKYDAAAKAAMVELADKKRQRLEGLLDAARGARRDHDYRRAASLVCRALEAAPDNAAAEELLAQVSAAAAETAEGLLASADGALEAGETGPALAHYRRALDLDPGNEKALTGVDSAGAAVITAVDRLASRADDALSEDRPRQARALLAEALSLDPYSAAARSVLKRIAESGSRFQNHRETQDADALYLEGVRFYVRGLYSEAMDAWKTVLSADPEDARARSNSEKTRRNIEWIDERRSG